MGWTNPTVLAEMATGVAFLILFCFIELHTDEPMFRLQLFKIRAFSAGVFASFLGALGRGGLMFMLIIWLQGIWLPRHGYTFAVTPLWAGIYILPLTAGFLIAGPLSGILSDRYGSRPFATFGMLGSALGFFLLKQIPVDFSYAVFGSVLFLMGLAMSSFGSSNRTGVMNSLPATDRGAGSGMNTTFQNSAQVLSIGIFFTLIIVGLSDHLPVALVLGLTAHGVPETTAQSISHLPPVSTLFAAFLGYNPAAHLLGPHALAQLNPAQRATITGERFFPTLITSSFKDGLNTAFDFAIVMSLAGAACSWTRGGKKPPQPDAV
jgi:MFS family permease